MAGLLLYGNSGEAALVASTAKTMLQIKAPANQRVLVRSLRLFGKQPAGGTDPVVKIRMTRSTANFGTGSSVTPGKNNPSNGETIQSVWAGNFSVEPTSPTDGGLWWELQPQSGIIELLAADKPIEIPGGQSAQFECTSTGTPTIMISAGAEE